jgi:hypothetical protein
MARNLKFILLGFRVLNSIYIIGSTPTERKVSVANCRNNSNKVKKNIKKLEYSKMTKIEGKKVNTVGFEVLTEVTTKKAVFCAIALMMVAARTSKPFVNSYHATRRYNPENSHLSTTFQRSALPPSSRQGVVQTSETLLNGTRTQKTAIFILTAVRTANRTMKYKLKNRRQLKNCKF